MRLIVFAALFCGIFLATTHSAFAADHVDSPIVKSDPTADITDLYSFVNPNDPSEYILAADVFPFANQGSQFSNAVEYTFHLQNGVGETNEIVCTFSNPQGSSQQTVTCTGPGNREVSGPLNQVNTNGDFRVFAGLRDDPFFFDFKGWKKTVETGNPEFALAPGTDFFAGLNVLSIVVGLPVEATNQNPSSKAHFTQKVWFSTDRTGDGAGIGPGLTGLWYDPENSGMGFLFEVNPASPMDDLTGEGPRLSAYWFFFFEGNPVWLHGTGPIEGDTATVPLVYTIGGGNLGSFNEADVTRTPVGILTVDVNGCNMAITTFDSEDSRFPDIEFVVQRLSEIKSLNCQFKKAGHIDRNGRPGVTTVLIAKPKNDAYNLEHDPSQWMRFQDEIKSRLMFIDSLDGNQGNQLLNYDALSALFADDRLIIATNIPNCGPYLAVELAPEGEDPEACGGRTLAADVVDASFTALIGIEAGDGVPGNDVPFLDEFPFLAPPQ